MDSHINFIYSSYINLEFVFSKLYDFEFKIKNLENRTCYINKIDVPCPCVVLNNDNPLFINPNSEVIIRAIIIPTGKGVFSKTIWLDTDFQRKPYELVVTGTL